MGNNKRLKTFFVRIRKNYVVNCLFIGTTFETTGYKKKNSF